MTGPKLLAFLREQRWAVQASVHASASQGTAPQAAVIGVAITDALEFVFDTDKTSRKAANLRAHPRVALVIGWDDGQTAQLEGIADEPTGADLARLKRVYLARFPDGAEREHLPTITYFRVRPTWVRYTDFRGAEPVTSEFDEAGLRNLFLN